MTATKHKVALDTAFYQDRVQVIQEYLGGQGLEGVLLLNPNNVMWASGFFHIPSERALGFYIPVQGTCTFFVPFLETEHVAENPMGDVCWYWEYPGEAPAEVWMLQQIEADRVAIDGISEWLWSDLTAVKPGLTLDGGVARMRYVKAPEELRLMELAAGFADFAVMYGRQAIADGLKDGITEIEVVEAVKKGTTAQMQEQLDDLTQASYAGAVGLSCHAGPRAALPHGKPGMVGFKPGDTVIIGVGTCVGGYRAESAGTFVVGDPTPDQMGCLEATWACDQAAVEALRVGATCQSVDDAALAVLREAGYGDFIRHRIGHGVGVQGHESPWLSTGDLTILEPNMVFSNEPGIYRPGVDGYRLIDTMVVTPEGGRRLSRFLTEHGPDDRVIPA